MRGASSAERDITALVFQCVLALMGATMAVTVLTIDWWRAEMPAAQTWGIVKTVGLGVGLCLTVVAALLRPRRVPGVLVGASLAGLSVTWTLAAVELVVRLIGYDPREPPEVLSSIPIYFRGATVVTGDVFARREGPARWEGKVLSQYLKYSGGTESSYDDEAEVVITYDRQGFRNPEELEDWEIVVVGDSFVELGYLPYEDLFTTHIQALTGKRVKNLGVSYTGNLTHTQYLKEYGQATSTKTALLVFFEGNDISDNVREAARLERASALVRGSTALPQSPEQWLRHLINRYPRLYLPRRLDLLWHPVKTWRGPNAYFQFEEAETPVTVTSTPPGEDQIPPGDLAILNSTLSRWAQLARELGMQPWIVYMPCKRRVLDGYLRFSPSAEKRLARWTPTDLPNYLRGVATRNQMGFVDVTYRLVEETKHGRLTFNTILDSHLNRHGSLIVARTIADALMDSLEKKDDEHHPPP